MIVYIWLEHLEVCCGALRHHTHKLLASSTQIFAALYKHAQSHPHLQRHLSPYIHEFELKSHMPVQGDHRPSYRPLRWRPDLPSILDDSLGCLRATKRPHSRRAYWDPCDQLLESCPTTPGHTHRVTHPMGSALLFSDRLASRCRRVPR